MQVNDALIENLSNLARLEFSPLEKEEIKKDLQRMISFVEKLSELDVSGVEPIIHMSDEMNVLRDDKVEGSCTREEALRNAPVTDGIYIKAPKVIKNRS